MNTQNFNQAGGFPLETDTLTAMQEAYLQLQAFGGAIGSKSIIKGCDIVGENTTDGFVYLNGELLAFKGGTTQTQVVVNEVSFRKQFNDGSEPEVVFERWMSFGTTTQSIDWSDFKRPKTTVQLTVDQSKKAEQTALELVSSRLQSIETLLLPFQSGGAMVLWNKPANQIPEGWREVTNWRGRMPVGFDPSQGEFNSIGKVGGSKTQALRPENNAPHTHGFRSDNYEIGNGLRLGGFAEFQTGIVDQRTKSQGKGSPFGILNPYRTVLFIEPTRTL